MIAGTGLDPDPPPVVMVKVDEFELPPPGAGLNTVTVAAPALAILLYQVSGHRFGMIVGAPLPEEPHGDFRRYAFAHRV